MLFAAVAALFLAAAPGRLPARGPWQTSGPAYPRVEAIALVPGDESVVFAAARDPESSTSGLFRSEDGGGTWTLLAQAPFQASVREVAIDPTGTQRMAALTTNALGHDILYRSEDAGVSWVQAGLFVADWTRAVFFDPVAADTAYLFGASHLARSEAGGAWEDIALENVATSGPVSAHSAWVSPHRGLYVAEETRYPGYCPILFHCVVDGIFVSTDQGRTFQDGGSPFCLDLESVAYAPSDSSIAYATGPNCEPLLASGDGGANWNRVDSSDLAAIIEPTPQVQARIAGIAVDPLDAARVFVTVSWTDPGTGLLLRSDDGGVHWTTVPVPEPPSGPLAIATNRVLFVGTVQGVFRLPLGRTQTLPPR